MLSAKFTHKGKIDSGALTRAVASWLPQASLSVEGQAKSLVPVDTGNLKGSINSRVSGNTGIVGTAVEYAEYVEYGTRFSKAKPYMRPAVDALRKRLTVLLQSIYDREVRKDGKS